MVFPMAAGVGLGLLFGFHLYESLFMGAVLTATSVSISAQTLMELGRLRTREGTTIMGAAIIDDVLGIIILSVVVALGGSSSTSVPLVITQMFLFFVLSIVIGSMLLEGIVSWVEKRARASEALFAAALVIIFVYSYAAQALGRVATITGSYIAGVLLSRTSAHKGVEKQVGGLTYGLLAPIFFVSIGLEADIHRLDGSLLLFALLITVAAVITKQFGCALGTLAAGFNWRQSLRVGTGMVSRGEVALIVAHVGLIEGVIGEDVFAVMVLMTLVTTIATPVMLRFVFREEKAEAGKEPAAHPGTGEAAGPAGETLPGTAPAAADYPSEMEVLGASADDLFHEEKDRGEREGDEEGAERPKTSPSGSDTR